MSRYSKNAAFKNKRTARKRAALLFIIFYKKKLPSHMTGQLIASSVNEAVNIVNGLRY